jgi:hypothetical protein
MCYRLGRPVDYAGQNLGDFEFADILCCGVTRAQFYRQYGGDEHGPAGHPFDFFRPEEDVWKHKKRKYTI